MKHTKGRFSIRKHPFIITFIIMAVIAVVVAVGYIDVNHRFPEPEEEIVEKDEWVQYSDGIKITVTGICQVCCFDFLFSRVFNFHLADASVV